MMGNMKKRSLNDVSESIKEIVRKMSYDDSFIVIFEESDLSDDSTESVELKLRFIRNVPFTIE